MNPEHEHKAGSTPEISTPELQDLAREQLEKLTSRPEHSVEHQHETAEKAREIIELHNEKPPQHERDHTPYLPHHNPFINYLHTMTSLRQRLSPTARRFSDVIHNPAIEQVSEVLERTVMRPSVTLGATSTALLVGTVLYVAARHYGFRLSGSEIIFSLLLGGFVGAAIELLSKPFRHRGR